MDESYFIEVYNNAKGVWYRVRDAFVFSVLFTSSRPHFSLNWSLDPNSNPDLQTSPKQNSLAKQAKQF